MSSNDIYKGIGVVGAGAAIGTGISYFNAEGPNESLQIGFGAGLAAVGGIYALGKNYKTIGKGTANATVALSGFVGDKGIKAGEYVGGKALDKGEVLGKKVIDQVQGLRKKDWIGGAKAIGLGLGDWAEEQANKVVTIPEGKNLSNIKLTGKGKMLIGAIALADFIQGAANQSETIAMGATTPYIEGPTPRLPSYADNAGATGDLVFALHKNKRPF